MGCASSKKAVSTNDSLFKLAPSSFAVFDINAIQEPWALKLENSGDDQMEKPANLPPQILEKLNKLEFNGNIAPQTWEEISKALQDLKPSINNNKIPDATSPDSPLKLVQFQKDNDLMKKPTNPLSKNASFHTLEELDSKLSEPKPKPPTKTELWKSDSTRGDSTRNDSTRGDSTEFVTDSGSGYKKTVKENIFIQRDRLEREKEGKQAIFDKLLQSRRDPLSQFPEKCPPGGTDSLVLYTTSLRGVRRTFEDCSKVRNILELHGAVFDERDVSLHGEFLIELKELMGEELSMPRVFMKGRYLGGVEEVNELNETGRLGRLLNAARVERGIGRQACDGCGGARFVPCLDCGGSCKVFNGGVKERCGVCNENGLVHCPACN